MTIPQSRRQFCAIGKCLALSGIISFASPVVGAASPLNYTPELYFYPPPYRLADGSLASSPLALGEDQLTALFPQIDEMSGVVVMVPWSSLAPVQGHYDFTLIDNVLKFWTARDKKIVLGVSTSGPPFKIVRDGVSEFKS